MPIVLPRRQRLPTVAAAAAASMAVDKKVADGLQRPILLKGDLGNCVFAGEYDRGVLRGKRRGHACDPENQSN